VVVETGTAVGVAGIVGVARTGRGAGAGIEAAETDAGPVVTGTEFTGAGAGMEATGRGAGAGAGAETSGRGGGSAPGVLFGGGIGCAGPSW